MCKLSEEDDDYYGDREISIEQFKNMLYTNLKQFHVCSLQLT